MTSDDSAPIRILVANLPETAMRRIVEMVEQQPQKLRLVGQVQGHLEVLMAAQDGVDLVILGALELKPPGIASHLLNEFPAIKVLVLSTTDDKAMGYWLGVQHYPIDPSTTSSLLSGIEMLFKMTPSL